MNWSGGLPTMRRKKSAHEILWLQNRHKDVLLLTMAHETPEQIRKKVAAHRARQIAAGRVAVHTFLSAETVEQLDRLKEQRGVSSRAPLIEEAVRAYIENLRT